MGEEAMAYWLAFIALARDRQYDSLSLGMGGGIRLPCVIPREAIRREAQRQGYAGDEFEDFVEIVAGLDDGFIEIGLIRKSSG